MQRVPSENLFFSLHTAFEEQKAIKTAVFPHIFRIERERERKKRALKLLRLRETFFPPNPEVWRLPHSSTGELRHSESVRTSLCNDAIH